MTATEKAYFRGDINGLRAVAVLAVVLFHLQLPAVAGGFLGVDVFFTISGYLITGSIVREVNSRRFSFKNFYYRRTRRLAPALIVTVACSFVAALILFPPSYLIQTSQAALSAIASVSNIYFWRDSGYFAADSSTKPLLHTWSLGLEEQFYLVWPLFVVVALRFRVLLPAILVLFVGGLFTSEVAVLFRPEAAFFLLPFRAFEFAIGAVVVFTERSWRQTGFLNEFVKILALVALIASFNIFDGTTPFPGLYALVPCAATAMVIHLGPTRFTALLLENPLSAFIGRISYSLYLVHWPIIVVYRFVAFRDITGAEKACLLIATALAGSLLYFAVERKFRYFDFVGQRRKLYAFIGATVAVCLLAGAAWAGQGWTWRSAGYLPAGFVDEQKDRRFTELGRLCDERSWATCWNIVPTNKKRVLIVGDSEATDGLNMVTPALAHEYLILSDTPGCPPFTASSTILKGPIPDRVGCIATNRNRVEPAYLAKFDVIVISALWSWYKPEHLRELLDFINASAPRAKVIVFGPYFGLKHPCWEYMQRERTADCFREDNIADKFLYEDDLKKIVNDHHYLYVSKRNLLCDDGKRCRFFTEDGDRIPMTWDEFHLSYEFALMVGAKAKSEIRHYVYGP